MARGTIKQIISDRHSGFIQIMKRGDMFFSFNELKGLDLNSLKEGQQVEFDLGQDGRGRLLAVKIRLA
jgi:cold shock CspA family protein